MIKAFAVRAIHWELALLFCSLVVANVAMFSMGTLGDYQVSFYKAVQYLVHGDNIYTSPYPHPYNGREYPPFNPIWAIYTIVPISLAPFSIAGSIRYFLDLALIPFVVYLCARMVNLKARWLIFAIVTAPWHFITLYSGQWTTLVFFGMLACYYGIRQRNVPLVVIGIWLALIKVNLTLLIIGVTLVFAWRNGMLLGTVVGLTGLVAVSSLAQPTWFYDLLMLYCERLREPRLIDSVLLLPGYPWAQLVLLTGGALFAGWYLFQTRVSQPESWFWALLVSVGLVSALHTFTYDWLVLSLPMIWLLRHNVKHLGFIIILYIYPLIWMIVLLTRGFLIHQAFFTPAAFMMLVVWGVLAPGFVALAYERPLRIGLIVCFTLVVMMVALILWLPGLSPAFIPGVVLVAVIMTIWRQDIWSTRVYAKEIERR